LIVRRKGRRRHRRALVPDAYLDFALFAGVGLASWKLDQPLRLTLLWLALLVVTVMYASGER
jgi:hypothetical protein